MPFLNSPFRPTNGRQSLLVAIEVGDNPRYPYKPEIPLTILVNPILTPVGEEMFENNEGCLSVPNLRGTVRRFVHLHVKAWDRFGNEIDETVHGLKAGTYQHEVDQLDGKIFVDRVTDLMDEYDIAGACHEIVAFIDALNNWYIRRSRDRFWAPGSVADGTLADDKRDAYDTLYTVLVNLLRLTAPLLPLLSDEMYRGLTSSASVHLADWPERDALPHDDTLVHAYGGCPHLTDLVDRIELITGSPVDDPDEFDAAVVELGLALTLDAAIGLRTCPACWGD